MTEIVKRMKKTTPKFFRKLRNTGLTLAAVGAAIITAPIALPAILIKAAGYIAVAGSVASAVSQTAVKHERE
ncbi:MAG: hypothetical protein E6H08_17555 [Bacteroidetes bacterium]|nr:MAG: hypothetical protein E6H08_17555 [Bacteroidota bacterium]